MLVSPPAFTVRLASSANEPSVPVTVWGPATVAVQTLAVHEPSGEIENVVSPVTSPRELPNWSDPVAP